MMTIEQQQNIEKFKELYEYSRDLHFKQIERANRIDRKAAIFLSATTILLGMTGFLIKSTINEIIPPVGYLQYAILVLSLLTGLAIIGSWFSFLSALRVKGLSNLRLDNSIIEFYEKTRRIDIHFQIAKRASEAFNYNNKQIKHKIIKIDLGYLLTITAVVLLLANSVHFLIYKWNSTNYNSMDKIYKALSINEDEREGKRGVANMDNKNDETGKPTPSSQPDTTTTPSEDPGIPADQPDSSLASPTNVIQTEAMDYTDVIKRDQSRNNSKKD